MALDWDRINIWTHTYYTIIHSLHLSKQIKFGNPDYLDDSFRDARNWISPECSYSSVLLAHKGGNKKLTFRCDPNKNFREVSRQVVKMLVQDLVVIVDKMLTEVLADRQETAGEFQKSKFEKLSTHLNPKYEWSYHGCLELIAVRNVLTHNNGKWNQKSIDYIKKFASPPPTNGEALIVGISMLFQYRKAIRTFLNEVKVA